MVRDSGPEPADIWNSACGMRAAAFGLVSGNAVFRGKRDFERLAFRGLAALVLVFCAGRSLCGNAAVFRHRVAPRRDFLPEAGLGGASHSDGSLRSRSVRFLHLGISHVFKRIESLLAAGVFAARVVARDSGFRATRQLVGYALGWRNSFDRGYAFCDRVHLAVSLRRPIGPVSGAT